MENKLLDAALKYATQYGWAVFPCNPQTKRPITPHGFKDAKKDPGPIRAWWKRYPDANIGIATGSMSNLLVIDLDLDADKGTNGVHEMLMWEQDHGELPETARAITGRGGAHIYYHYEGTDFKNRTGIIDGVDVRAEGGYVIAPPSIHENGTAYEWEDSPEDVGISEIDENVRKFLAIGANEREAHEPLKIPATIESGYRNSTLHKLACSLQAQGLADDTIFHSVMQENLARCQPPLDEKEVETIVKSALRYKKGELKIIDLPDDPQHPPKLAYKIDKNGDVTDQVAQTIKNCEEVIRYDAELYGRIRMDELSQNITVYGNLPWKQHKGWRDWTNSDDNNLWSYMESKYGLSNQQKIFSALNNVAARRPVNLVKEFLENAHEQWDGNKHIENLLPQFVGTDKTDYNTECLKLFMLGAIKRIYHPGCKFDYMIILVGKQGGYKSSFLRFLAMNDSWFSDNFNTLDGVRAFEQLRGMWMVEVSELQAIKRQKDQETVKAFITSRVDVYRAAYDRRTERHPRMYVLAGTSNPGDFLIDRTGNRRFLPITCNKHKIPSPFDDEQATKFEFFQAWGEAMDIFMRAGGNVRLVLPKEYEEQALAAQMAYTEEDPDVGIIQQWLDTKAPHRVCVRMIWDEPLNHELLQITRQETNRLHDIMKNQISGWRYSGKQRCGKYGLQRCYDKVM